VSRLVFGIQPVREAIRVHGNAIERLLILDRPNGKESRTLDGVAKFAEASGVATERVDRRKLEQVAHGGNHQGIAAFAPELRINTFAELLETAPDLVTLLDRITDPQNFGAIIRSSVAFGSRGIIWPEHDSAPLSPATFRASAGAVEHASLCRVRSLPSAIQALRHEGFFVVGLAGEGSEPLDQFDLTRPTALVVGAEGSGLRKGVRSACDVIARLPTGAPLDTLNASVSAGVALYEVRRQRLAASHESEDGAA